MKKEKRRDKRKEKKEIILPSAKMLNIKSATHIIKIQSGVQVT
jgi:hypothetical protein